jgi:hypothetical protein
VWYRIGPDESHETAPRPRHSQGLEVLAPFLAGFALCIRPVAPMPHDRVEAGLIRPPRRKRRQQLVHPIAVRTLVEVQGNVELIAGKLEPRPLFAPRERVYERTSTVRGR